MYGELQQKGSMISHGTGIHVNTYKIKSDCQDVDPVTLSTNQQSVMQGYALNEAKLDDSI